MEYFIDTNVFLRVLVKEDNKTFSDCFNFLDLVRNGKIKAFTSDIVLAEINWTLSSFYKFKKQDTLIAIKGILNLKSLKFRNESDIYIATDLYEKFNVKFIDSLIASNLSICNKQTTIVSYDKDFDKLKLLRKEPQDFKKNMENTKKEKSS